jgi:hypothetical protein
MKSHVTIVPEVENLRSTIANRVATSQVGTRHSAIGNSIGDRQFNRRSAIQSAIGNSIGGRQFNRRSAIQSAIGNSIGDRQFNRRSAIQSAVGNSIGGRQLKSPIDIREIGNLPSAICNRISCRP